MPRILYHPVSLPSLHLVEHRAFRCDLRYLFEGMMYEPDAYRHPSINPDAERVEIE
jgi:hypothetical protein